MNSKILLLTIAAISVGLFAMPTTLSLFAGQHTFQGSPKCADCHADIVSEMSTATAHKSFTGTTDKECVACHQSGGVNASLIPKGDFTGNFSGTQNVGWNATTGNFTYPNATNKSYGAHAAVTLECVFCHTQVNTSFTDDAHKPLADNIPVGLMKGKNAVCVSCHTKATTQIVFVRFKNATITYNFTQETNKLTWSNGSMNTTYVNRT